MVKLLQKFQMHLRLQGESRYGYLILDGDSADRVIGYKSTVVPTGRNARKAKPSTVLTLKHNDQRFEDVADFLKAYEQQLRDEEFDAADPAKKVSP